MSLVTKKNAKSGLKVYVCVDERPLNGFDYCEGVITDVFEDHYLYATNDLQNVWGFYDTDVDNDSVAVFTTEAEAKRRLKIC